jgi:hypothetical protein
MASEPGVDGREKRGSGVSPLKAVAFALLLGESVVILIPSIYGSATPKLFGIAFFYWFQLMWIIVGMIVTGLAYLLWEHAERRLRGATPGTTASAPTDGREMR